MRLITLGNQVVIVPEDSIDPVKVTRGCAVALTQPVPRHEELGAAMNPTETPALTQEGSV